MDSCFGPPFQLLLVSHHRGSEGAAIVATPSNQHTANARHFAISLEGQGFRMRRRPQLSIPSCGYLRGLIVVSCKQRVLLRVELDFRAVYVELG